MKLTDAIYGPMTIYGRLFTREDLKAIAVEGFANVAVMFRAADMVGYVPDQNYQASQEILNRLFQRWRKLGLMEFHKGRWNLTRGAWDKFQSAR